jgi:division protein CdvB (Snf7/Vps24/ESCRT-III family)
MTDIDQQLDKAEYKCNPDEGQGGKMADYSEAKSEYAQPDLVATKAPIVTEALSSLNDANSRLIEVISNLQGRLHSVLTHFPAEADSAGKDLAPLPSSVHQRIVHEVNTLQSATTRLEDIISRLEV